MKKSILLLITLLISSVSFSQNKDESDIFTIVETMPEYPGGDAALMQFIAENTVYPEKAKAKNITGVVYVSYIVSKDGSVKKVKVVRGAHKLLDKEAVRVVRLLKGYKPGTQKGKAVNVQFTVPLRFVLNK